MWKTLISYLPSMDVWIGASASLLIPLIVTRLMQSLREWGNPPWLKKQQMQQHRDYYQVKQPDTKKQPVQKN